MALSLPALALPAGLALPSVAHGAPGFPQLPAHLQLGALTPAQVQQLAANVNQKVIVILRDQQPTLAPTGSQGRVRAAAFASAQAPLLAELGQVQARNVHPFRLINAISATVSAAEETRLKSNPLVQAVVPDAVVPLPRSPVESDASAAGASAGAAAAPASALCNTLEPEALQLTNAAFSDPSIPQAQQVVDGNGQKVTGAGVKVAFLADGMDPNIAGFIRPDGSPVFVDYRDFSGAGPVAPTGGAEAFGDASSIAAQDMPNGTPLTFDISKFVSPAHPLPSPCPIRIRGMAPGASLVGLDIFTGPFAGYDSTIVQAIEYAVLVDHVDVINESFGGNPFPDRANDPIAMADDAAVRAGVTVVASSGDAGSAGTLGSPSTDPNVISAGASTQFRSYAQTAYQGYQMGSGYISNNISSLSSGGFSQSGPRLVDVVAPGDLGWALCSTNTEIYTECTSFAGKPAPIQLFGGTSEASPLTAGEAALVIQAYRSTHGGKSPSPALIKQIIMSTATDLAAPPYEQGAGLINALKAVQAALSVPDANGTPRLQGNALLVSPNTDAVVGEPNTPQKFSFTVTNVGSRVEFLRPQLVTLGPASAGGTVTLQLNPAVDPTYLNVTGARRDYVKQTFTVPSGMERLDVAISWVTKIDPNAIAYLILFDPAGRLAAYSLPQGFGSGYGHVDVGDPSPGLWTAIVGGRPSGFGAYTGPVQLTWSASRFANLNTALSRVDPPVLILAPGQSKQAVATFLMPSQPGDLSAEIRFTPPSYFTPSGPPPTSPYTNPPGVIPVTLRTLVPLTGSGGSFTGTITGGNGRAGTGPTQTFAFDVPAGLQDLALGLSLNLPDTGYNLEGLLVDPNGMELDVQSNITAEDDAGNPTAYSNALQFFRYNPQPGRWRLILLLNFTASGLQTSVGFTAHIGLNTAKITASGLPNSASTMLPAGKPVTVPISIVNNGVTSEQYFADARLTVSAWMPLLGAIFNGNTLPGSLAEVFVPTETSVAAFEAHSTVPVPINMSAFNEAGAPPYGGTGSPDLWATPPDPKDRTTVQASLSVPEVPYGPWFIVPGEIGPYLAPAPTVPVAYAAAGFMQEFDTAVSADSGDLWADFTLNTNTYNPLVLAPGQSGTIHVTITPDPKLAGKTVSGYLYVDTFNPATFNGDEVVRIPYSYTVAPA